MGREPWGRRGGHPCAGSGHPPVFGRVWPDVLAQASGNHLTLGTEGAHAWISSSCSLCQHRSPVLWHTILLRNSSVGALRTPVHEHSTHLVGLEKGNGKPVAQTWIPVEALLLGHSVVRSFHFCDFHFPQLQKAADNACLLHEHDLTSHLFHTVTVRIESEKM